MKKEEERVLIHNKLRDGKGIDQAILEIKQLQKSQTDFKNYKSQIEQLLRLAERLRKERNDLANKNFKLNIKLNSKYEEKREKQKENGNKTIRHLNRILLILREEKEPVAQGMLSKICMIHNKDLYSCLGFLEKENLIKSIRDNGVVRYYIEK